ncbi:MAG: copper resistance CopC family protein [Janthinobacterium lividum]
MTHTNARRTLRTRAVPAALALAAAAVTAAPRPAAAHAVLVASTPAPGGTVAPGALAVALRFNSRIDRVRSKVSLVGPDAAAARLAVDAAGPADQLSAATTLAPGAYTLRWQVLATDGHITRGDVPFTVAPPGAGTVAPATGN